MGEFSSLLLNSENCVTGFEGMQIGIWTSALSLSGYVLGELLTLSERLCEQEHRESRWMQDT